jgi:hypothetical protein
MSDETANATPKAKGSRSPTSRRLPALLRRHRGAPVAAQQPGFWKFGPPAEGKGPKPIRYSPPSRDAADGPGGS